jgi:hypothetical protein
MTTKNESLKPVQYSTRTSVPVAKGTEREIAQYTAQYKKEIEKKIAANATILGRVMLISNAANDSSNKCRALYDLVCSSKKDDFVGFKLSYNTNFHTCWVNINHQTSQ